MARTHNDSSGSYGSEVKHTMSSGSLPYIFENRKYSNLIKKIELPHVESIHYIKHTPVRLTRTRASMPTIGSGEYFTPETLCEIASPRRPLYVLPHETEFSLFSKGISRRPSAIIDDGNEQVNDNDVILTPFAQILSNLHLVRDNIFEIGGQEISYKLLNDNTEDELIENGDYKVCHNTSSDVVKVTLESLDWCLRTLENIQTHRAVSDLTTTKFLRIINHELQQNDNESLSDIQFCDYICDTFLERKPIDDESFGDEKDSTSNKSMNNSDVSLLNMQFDNGAATLKILDSSIDKWGIDLFEIGEHTENILTLTTFSIFQKRRFMSKFNIAQGKLLNFLMKLEGTYRNVPYHNSMHAADVTQSSHVILNSADLQDVFTDLEMLAVIFASAIHDVDHPGVTNQFLINTNDPLSTLYNDHSVLENHHLATAFGILKEEKYDILSNLNKQEKLKFRKLVIDMVLATDMSGHMPLLADLRTMVESKKVVGLGHINLDNYYDRIKILQCILHCTDLSNPTKPLPIYQKWVSRILSEFRTQGDQERQLGIDISPMLTDDKSQIGFIDYIVQPLWETWCDLVRPDDQSIIENLNSNRRFYSMRLSFSDVMEETNNDENDEE